MVGACFGTLLFLGSIFLLGWNEFNFVRNVKILDKVTDSVIEVGCSPLYVNMGQPIWTSCPMTQTFDFATDSRLANLVPIMNSMNSASGDLKGAVFTPQSQILQWTENKSDKKGDDEYSYKQEWVSSKVDSSSFYCVQHPGASGCPNNVSPNNIGDIPSVLKSAVEAPQFTLAIGNTDDPSRSYFLNAGLSHLIPFIPLSLTSGNLGTLPGLSANQQATISQSTLRLSSSPNQVTVGDVQTTFQLAAAPSTGNVYNTIYSVIALQSRDPSLAAGSAVFDAWGTGMKGSFSAVSWLQNGHATKSEMVENKKQENSSTTWVLRMAGFLCMFLGLVLVTHPVAVVPELLPCCGSYLREIVGCILCSLCFCVSLGLSTLVIGAAWVAARPLVGGLLLAGAAAVFIGAFCIHHRGRKEQRSGARVYLTQMS